MSAGGLRSPPKYKPFLGGSPATELTTEVTKMLSPQTAGELQPVPGISVFHATLSVVLHLSRRLGYSATPSEPGPRNCAQLLCAIALVTSSAIKERAINCFLIMFFSAKREFRVQGSGFRVQGSGFRVQGSELDIGHKLNSK